MAVCPKCGANNPTDRQACRACGEPLGDRVEVMNALQQKGLGGSVGDDEHGGTPEWLQLLLAKYGEEPPTLSLSTPAIAEEEPPAARPAIREMPSPQRKLPTNVEPEEIPDWLESLRGERFGDGEEAQRSPKQQVGDGEEFEDAREADAVQAAGWLSRLESASSDPQPPAVVNPRKPAEDIPDWLASSLDQAEVLAGSEPDISRREGPVVVQESEDAPDWLSRLGGVKEPPETQKSLQDGEAGESPDEQAYGTAIDQLGVPESVQPSLSTAKPPPPAILMDELEIEEALRATKGETPPAIIDTGELRAHQAGVGEESEATPPAIRQEQEGVPDWLSQLISVQAETSGEVSGEEPDEGMTQEPETIQAAAEVPAGADRHAGGSMVEIPPWLAELNVSELEELEPVDTELAEIPASLEEMDREAAGSSVASPAVPRLGETQSIPSVVEVVQTPQAGPSGEGEALPDWLSQLQSLDETESFPLADVSPRADEPTAVDTGTRDDWLTDLESMGSGAATLPAKAEKQPAGEEDAVPDWLTDMQSEIPDQGKTEDQSVTEEALAVNGGLERADIPQWMMRLKPEAGREGGGTEKMPGLPDVLPISDDASDEETFATLRSRLAVPDVPDVEGASLFRKIASDAAESRPMAEEKSKGSRLFATLVWALAFLILIIAIAITLMAVLSRAENLLGAPAFQEYLNSPGAAGLVGSVQGFRAEIATLPEDSVVLVCFDYSPATEAEMGPLAQVVLDDLSQHQMRVMAVSLSPEGAMMAHRLIEYVSEQYPETRAVNFGYLPGNAMGIRSLANILELTTFEGGQRLSAVSGWEDVDELADVAMMVEISDNNNTVRWWVEQQQVLGLVDQPLLAAVSAAAAPASQPYRDANLISHGHLEEMISGVTAAAAYEFYLGKPGRATRGLAAQSTMHLGLVFVAVAGTIAGFRHQ